MSYAVPVSEPVATDLPITLEGPEPEGEVALLRGLLEEVRAAFTRDDDLPGNLLPRIDAALEDKV